MESQTRIFEVQLPDGSTHYLTATRQYLGDIEIPQAEEKALLGSLQASLSNIDWD